MRPSDKCALKHVPPAFTHVHAWYPHSHTHTLGTNDDDVRSPGHSSTSASTQPRSHTSGTATTKVHQVHRSHRRSHLFLYELQLQLFFIASFRKATKRAEGKCKMVFTHVASTRRISTLRTPSQFSGGFPSLRSSGSQRPRRRETTDPSEEFSLAQMKMCNCNSKTRTMEAAGGARAREGPRCPRLGGFSSEKRDDGWRFLQLLRERKNFSLLSPEK